MRPKVGLDAELSIVIIGLSWSVPGVIGRPVVSGCIAVVPAAIRFTTVRLGTLPCASVSDPIQMLPSVSAAAIGSQHTLPDSVELEPGLSSVCGSVRSVQLSPPSFEIHADMLGLCQFTATATRFALPSCAAM